MGRQMYVGWYIGMYRYTGMGTIHAVAKTIIILRYIIIIMRSPVAAAYTSAVRSRGGDFTRRDAGDRVVLYLYYAYN